jgi:hypothetical protein
LHFFFSFLDALNVTKPAKSERQTLYKDIIYETSSYARPLRQQRRRTLAFC